MGRGTAGRQLVRAVTVSAVATAGMVLLSGTGQPVTAHSSPHWQRIASPPISARTDALAVRVSHWVLLLGGRAGAARPHDGAAYDLRTGIWHRVVTPLALSRRDQAVPVGRALVVAAGRGQRSWWYVGPGLHSWLRMAGLPAGLRAPSAFAGALYALSGRRVEVYSPQLARWSSLPPDRLDPALRGASVSASRTGTMVTGRAAGRLVTDRWDGLRWTRSQSALSPPTDQDSGEVRLDVGGQVFLVRGEHAWIRLP